MQQYFSTKKQGEYLVISELDYHHIKNVMRFKSGDKIMVVFDSQLFNCELIFLEDSVLAKILSQVQHSPELKNKITLIYGIPKGDKFEFVLQKACELGVSTIVPFLSERTIVKIEDNKVEKKRERWQKIIKEAAEQSHRTTITEVIAPIKQNELVKYLSEVNICGSEQECGKGSTALFNILKEKPGSISVIVGPEGGFSHQEFEYFEELGFKGVSFGNRILRSETAALYIVSIIAFMLENGENDE